MGTKIQHVHVLVLSSEYQHLVHNARTICYPSLHCFHASQSPFMQSMRYKKPWCSWQWYHDTAWFSGTSVTVTCNSILYNTWDALKQQRKSWSMVHYTAH